MDKNITAREKIKALLKIAKMSAKVMNDNSEMLENITEYEELLKNTDEEIEKYILRKREENKT